MEALFSLHLNTFLFALFTLLWWMEFLFFGRDKEKKASIEGPEKRSLSFKWILLAILLPLSLSSILFLKGIGTIHEPLASSIRSIGTLLYGIGLTLRYWSIILLGRHFSRQVQVIEGQSLVSHGPYRLLRHPSYTGLLLLNTGLHLYIGNIPGLLLATISLSLALMVRIREEERSMEMVLGDMYLHWKEERYHLVPWIY